MASIKCGSCKGTHHSVYAVSTCYKLELRIAELEAIQALPEEDRDGEDYDGPDIDWDWAADRAEAAYSRSIYGD